MFSQWEWGLRCFRVSFEIQRIDSWVLSGGLTCNRVRGLRDARKMESDSTSQYFTSHGFQGVLHLLNTCFMIRLSCGLNETFVMYLAKILGPKKHSVFLLHFYFLVLFFIAWVFTNTALTLSCVNGELSRICISDGRPVFLHLWGPALP